MKKTLILFGILLLQALFHLSPALVHGAAAEGYTLDIFGNANENATIDMGDVSHTERIILGLDTRTRLSDANNDGRINMMDATQIELLIHGKAKTLTLIDDSKRIVTLNLPIKRIASSSMPQDIRTICALGAVDKIVGIPDAISGKRISNYRALFLTHPELAKLPVAGKPYYGGPYLEAILSMKPDLVLVSYADAEVVQKATGIPTIVTPPTDEEALGFNGFKWLRTLGYIVGRQGRAEELTSYYYDMIEDVQKWTSSIADKDKPKVYLAFWGKLTYTPTFYGPVEPAGGKFVADTGAPGPYSTHMWEVSKEQIISWNPDVILLHANMARTLSTEDVLSDPDLKIIDAVRNGSVHYTKSFQYGWDPATGIAEAFYMAKIFHPDRLADLDVEQKCNEIMKKIYGVDGIWTDMTDFFKFCRW